MNNTYITDLINLTNFTNLTNEITPIFTTLVVLAATTFVNSCYILSHARYVRQKRRKAKKDEKDCDGFFIDYATGKHVMINTFREKCKSNTEKCESDPEKAFEGSEDCEEFKHSKSCIPPVNPVTLDDYRSDMCKELKPELSESERIKEEKKQQEIFDAEHKNVKIDESEIRKLYKYAKENQVKIRERKFDNTRVFLVFKKEPDAEYIVEDNDDNYYSLKEKIFINIEQNTTNNVLGVGLCSDPSIDNKNRQYIHNLLGNDHRKGICNKNLALKNAYINFYYEKYDETIYIALKFKLNNVLEWTLPDESSTPPTCPQTPPACPQTPPVCHQTHPSCFV